MKINLLCHPPAKRGAQHELLGCGCCCFFYSLSYSVRLISTPACCLRICAESCHLLELHPPPLQHLFPPRRSHQHHCPHLLLRLCLQRLPPQWLQLAPC